MKTRLLQLYNIFIVLFIFAVTGSTTAYISGKITTALGIEPWTVWFFLSWLLFIFPLYQALTLVFAFIFGKFDMFYSRQKKVYGRIAGLFRR